MSDKIYYQIPTSDRPDLKPVVDTMLQADGSPLHALGLAVVEIKVGSATVNMEVQIAKIKEETLLGMDFLEQTGSIIDVQNRQLQIGHETIPCHDTEGNKFCCRVSVSNTVTIPPRHEAIISGKVKNPSDAVGLGIVESVKESKIEESGAMIGRTVIDIDKADLNNVPMRVFNPTLSTVTVKKGACIGTISPVVACEKVGGRCSSEESDQDVIDKIPAYLRDLYEASVTELPPEHHRLVAELLIEYQDIFSSGDNDLGRTGRVRHSINTRAAESIRSRFRRMAPVQQAEADRQIRDMLKRGLIEPSTSPWSSPIVLVTKKDGSRRFCVDYRKLNSVTVKDSYPIPRIDESLDSLTGAKWFSTLDLSSGYWQVELDQDAKEKSAFVVRGGLYQWTVMPFGLCNAPSTFERLMENIMTGLQWEVLLIYLDDIIVFGKTVEEEIQRLRLVFQRLREANLKLKPKKCALFQKSVLYLGHVVSEAGITTDPEKIQVVREWPTPKCLREVRSFIGLTSYYRRYVKGYSDIARPLQALTEKSRIFRWTDECEEAFRRLKRLLSSAPILSYPDPSGGKFYLDTDASGYGIGAVLSQEQGGQERVIAYASRALKKPERNYCVTRRELLAVVTYVKHFKPYLYGRGFVVRTDHGSLRWLLNFQNPEGQVARWIQVLGEYDYQVIHRPGKGHGNADGLSRKPCPQCQLLDDDQRTVSGKNTKDPAKQRNKSVRWKPDSELVELHHFVFDPEERVNVSKVRNYFWKEYYGNSAMGQSDAKRSGRLASKKKSCRPEKFKCNTKSQQSIRANHKDTQRDIPNNEKQQNKGTRPSGGRARQEFSGDSHGVKQFCKSNPAIPRIVPVYPHDPSGMQSCTMSPTKHLPDLKPSSGNDPKVKLTPRSGSIPENPKFGISSKPDSENQPSYDNDPKIKLTPKSGSIPENPKFGSSLKSDFNNQPSCDNDPKIKLTPKSGSIPENPKFGSSLKPDFNNQPSCDNDPKIKPTQKSGSIPENPKFGSSLKPDFNNQPSCDNDPKIKPTQKSGSIPEKPKFGSSLKPDFNNQKSCDDDPKIKLTPKSGSIPENPKFGSSLKSDFNNQPSCDNDPKIKLTPKSGSIPENPKFGSSLKPDFNNQPSCDNDPKIKPTQKSGSIPENPKFGSSLKPDFNNQPSCDNDPKIKPTQKSGSIPEKPKFGSLGL